MILNQKSVLERFARELHRPMSIKEMVDEFGLDRRARLRLENVVRDLVARGDLVRLKGDRFGLPRRMNLVVGELSCSPKGYGFVRPEKGRDAGPDVFVRMPNLGGALHGDRVVARVEHRKEDGRLSGSVIRILERANARLLGRFQRGPAYAFVVPMEPKILTDVIIAPDATGGAREGQIVEVAIDEYPGQTREASGRVIALVGSPDDPKIDLELVLREHQLPRAFPAEVRHAAEAVPESPSREEAARRKDFRAGVVVTIDGAHARDFDDAVAARRRPEGGYRIEIHIADVSHYVRPSSVLDGEARARGTSVYFPDHVIPMLPEELSNGICSLNPGVDRLVLSLEAELDDQGVLERYQFHEGIIRSRARLTYDAVHAALSGEGEGSKAVPAELLPHLETMHEVALRLGQRRRERGSIDFDLPESEIVLDVAGAMTGIKRGRRLLSHNLIEEFMIFANEVVATHFVNADLPSMYRVHDTPDVADVEELNKTLAHFGYEVAARSPLSFREVMERARGKPEERIVSTVTLRTMPLAAYSSANSGHFGLASIAYTHFTSPIRRYPDLLVHRRVRDWLRVGAVLEGETRERLRGELEESAFECSRLERRAQEGEREYIERKKARFMADKVGEVFWGNVTSVEAFGFFVELEEYFVEGLVHLSSLDDDYYAHDESRHRLVGQHGGRILTLGDRLEVEVSHVDLLRRKIDFILHQQRAAEASVSKAAAPRARPAADRRRRGRRS